MATNSLKSILDRDMSKVLAKGTTQVAIPLIQNIVNDATYVFSRCLDSSKEHKGPHDPTLLSYLHMIEMTDAIEALIREACSAPVVLFLRSSFETLLSLKYLLEKDYTRRSLAHLICSAHRSRKIYNLFDPKTPEGKEFLHDWDIDLRRYWRGTSIIGHAKEARQASTSLKRILGQEKYTDVENEYQILRKKSGRIEWYQFFGGPLNIRNLSKHFDYRDRYDFLYRSWATVSHGMDITRFIITKPDEHSFVKRLRDSSHLSTYVVIAISFMLEAKLLMLNKFHPGEEASIKRWYKNNIRGKFLALAESKI